MKLAFALLACLIAFPALAADAPKPRADELRSGRYRIETADGRAFMIDTATGAVWLWAWHPAARAECQNVRPQSTADNCLIWGWHRTMIEQ